MFEFDQQSPVNREFEGPPFYRRHFLWTALSLWHGTVRALRRRINSPRSCGALNWLTCKALNALLSQDIDPFPIVPLKKQEKIAPFEMQDNTLTCSLCSKDSVLRPSKVINFGDKGGHGVRPHSKGLDSRSVIEEAASNLRESSNYRAKNQSGEGAASVISMSLLFEWIFVRSLQSWGKQQVHVDWVGSCGSCHEAFSIVVQQTQAALQGFLVVLRSKLGDMFIYNDSPTSSRFRCGGQSLGQNASNGCEHFKLWHPNITKHAEKIKPRCWLLSMCDGLSMTFAE